MSETSSYARPGGGSLPMIGGVLGIAGTFIGMAIFVAGCFGFGAAFTLSLIPTILGTIGLVLAFFGGLATKRIAMDDPQVVAALVINLAVVAGGLLEVAVWLNKPIFAGASGL